MFRQGTACTWVNSVSPAYNRLQLSVPRLGLYESCNTLAANQDPSMLMHPGDTRLAEPLGEMSVMQQVTFAELRNKFVVVSESS